MITDHIFHFSSGLLQLKHLKCDYLRTMFFEMRTSKKHCCVRSFNAISGCKCSSPWSKELWISTYTWFLYLTLKMMVRLVPMLSYWIMKTFVLDKPTRYFFYFNITRKELLFDKYKMLRWQDSWFLTQRFHRKSR